MSARSRTKCEHQRALPMLCQSLQAVSSYLGYPWPDDLKNQFHYRMFDALTRETDEDGARLVPERVPVPERD